MPQGRTSTWGAAALRRTTISSDTRKPGMLTKRWKQFIVRIQAYIDTWFVVGPGKRRRQHHYLAQPFISRSRCRRQGPCSCSFSPTVNIRELSHCRTGKRSCRSSSTWTVWTYWRTNWIVQVSEGNKLRYWELNAMLYRIKVIDENLFMRLANGEPRTPVCYFPPKVMNR